MTFFVGELIPKCFIIVFKIQNFGFKPDKLGVKFNLKHPFIVLSILICGIYFSFPEKFKSSSEFLSRIPAQVIDTNSLDYRKYYEWQELLTENASEARKKELAIIGDNIIKYHLYAAGKPAAEQALIKEKLRLYAESDISKFLKNLEVESSGKDLEMPYRFSRPPIWNLEEEILFLDRAVAEQSSDNIIFDDKSLASIKNNALTQWRTKGVQAMINEYIDTSFGLASQIYSEQKTALASQLTTYIDNLPLSFNDKTFTLFLKKFLGHYFTHIDAMTFKTIISEILNLGKNPTQEAITTVFFRNCGPGLGKVLQQLGKEKGIGDSLRPIIETLEDSGKPVPFHLVEKLVQEDGGFTFKSIGEEALGTGTMAQVHKAVVKSRSGDENVALRFLKPGIEQRALKDIEILSSFIASLNSDPELSHLKIPNIDKLIDSTRDFLLMELDIEKTIDRQEMAYALYERSIRVDVDNTDFDIDFKVPKVYRSDKASKLHVQEFVVFGEKFSQMDDLMKQKAVGRGLFRLWFEEALFRSGFMHADLHQGNFTVTVSEKDKRISVHIFDYGMTEVLPIQARKGFIMMALGEQIGDAEVLTRGIIAANEGKLKVKKQILLNDVKEALRTKNFKDIVDWVNWCVEKGYLINDSIGTLARGSMLVNQLPSLVGDKGIAVEEFKRMGLREFYNAVTDRKIKYPIRFRDASLIGRSHVKKQCASLFNSIFGK